jgi:hypothetical protein
MARRYRSWVVRAWSRDGQGAVRLTIEEIRSGRLVELWGERAAEIGGLISAASVTATNGDDGPDCESSEALAGTGTAASRPSSQ